MARQAPHLFAALGHNANPLPFSMQTATQTEWCWAAVAASVSSFYRPTSIWTQCFVANRALADVLGGSDCCADGNCAACNQDWYLDRALTCTLNLAAPASGAVGFDHITAEIDAGRPLGCRFQWDGGNAGHFFVIYGYIDDGSQTVFTRDPAFRDGSITLAQLSSSYLGMPGIWTHVYFTRQDP